MWHSAKSIYSRINNITQGKHLVTLQKAVNNKTQNQWFVE